MDITDRTALGKNTNSHGSVTFFRKENFVYTNTKYFKLQQQISSNGVNGGGGDNPSTN